MRCVANLICSIKRADTIFDPFRYIKFYAAHAIKTASEQISKRGKRRGVLYNSNFASHFACDISGISVVIRPVCFKQ